MTHPTIQAAPERWTIPPLDRRALAGMAAAAVFGAVIVGGVSFAIPREYSASVFLLPANAERSSGLGAVAGQMGGFAALAGIDLGRDDHRSESIATLRSRSLAVDFIEQRNLMPLIFSRKWDDAKGRWRSLKPADVPTIGDAYRRFDQNIRFVAEDRRTGIVTLTIRWRDPEVAANWANELAARVNLKMRERAVHEAQRSLEYLNKELEKTQVVELRQPIYRLIENRINTVMLANVQDEFAFKVVDAALAPDVDDYTSPLHWLYGLSGAVLGALAAAIAAVRRRVRSQDGR